MCAQRKLPSATILGDKLGHTAAAATAPAVSRRSASQSFSHSRPASPTSTCGHGGGALVQARDGDSVAAGSTAQAASGVGDLAASEEEERTDRVVSYEQLVRIVREHIKVGSNIVGDNLLMRGFVALVGDNQVSAHAQGTRTSSQPKACWFWVRALIAVCFLYFFLKLVACDSCVGREWFLFRFSEHRTCG